jgi:hypothetical protein
MCCSLVLSWFTNTALGPVFIWILLNSERVHTRIFQAAKHEAVSCLHLSTTPVCSGCASSREHTSMCARGSKFWRCVVGRRFFVGKVQVLSTHILLCILSITVKFPYIGKGIVFSIHSIGCRLHRSNSETSIPRF